MKRVLIFFIVLMILSIPVKAEEYSVEASQAVENSLDSETREYLEENGIDINSTDWISEIDAQTVFGHIWEFFKSGASIPLKAGCSALGIILITASFSAFSSGKGVLPTAVYVGVLCIVGILAVPIYSAVTAAVSAIKGCATFMLSFVPVFAAVVTVSGGAVTSVSMSTLLLAAAEGISAAAAFVILPIMGGYLAVGISSSVSPLCDNFAVAESIKKIAMWILSLITTVFLGVLSIQTAVNSAADSLTLRTSKFIVGTVVPIAGAAVAEAAGTVTASMQMLKSTVGIYGIIALAVILLPIILELCLWRIVMMLLNFASGMLGEGKTAALLKAIDAMLSLLIGIILLVGVGFIISLNIVVNSGYAAMAILAIILVVEGVQTFKKQMDAKKTA